VIRLGLARRSFALWLGALTLLALVVRLAIIASPLGELDADEAVVGLMARHIALNGERPVFYYGQPYMGSLEAFSAAPLFALFNSSAVLLKLVPLAYSVGFLVLSAVLARRLFGNGPALVTAAYLAVPPAMWATWSVKARGGYAEVLCLGEALLLLSLWLAEPPRPPWGALPCGLVAGLAVWTDLLAVVYVIPAGLYLLARRRRWSAAEVALGLAGCLIGAAPLVVDNLTQGFETSSVMSGPEGVGVDVLDELRRFFRVALSMLAGTGRPIPPPTLALDLDRSVPTAGPLPLVAPVILALVGVVAWHAPALRRLLTRAPGADSEPAILVLLALTVPAVLAVTPYGYFVAEPRYALPLYSTVPLLANVVCRLPRLLSRAVPGLLLVLNLVNIVATAREYARPPGTIDTTPANRETLVDYLLGHERHQMYTDYSIAYTTMFESREVVQAAVVAGGPNRYLPSADNVVRTPNAVWVFLRDSEADQQFVARLREVGGSASAATVADYHVYFDVPSSEALLPPT
jgi:hypothetical protein